MNPIEEAIHLLEHEQTEQALDLLQEYLGTADDNDKYTIAELYLQWGFLEESKTVLDDLMERYPNDHQLKLLLADIFIEQDDDEHAINLLNQIDEEDEAFVPALLQLADLYQVQGLIEVAEQKLLQAKQIAPNEEIIDFALGELFFSNGEYNRAANYYEKLHVDHISNVSIRERLAESFAASGQYEKALEYFQNIKELNVDTLFRYGLTAYQAKRNDIAINAWKAVLEKDPYYHSVYPLLAKTYQMEEMFKEAYDIAKKGISVDEYNKELFYQAGLLAHKLHLHQESKELLSQAIALDPDYKEAVLSAIEQMKAEGAYNEIVELIREIKKSGADDSLYDWELARAFREMESYNDALNHYREAYNNLQQDSEFLKEYGYFLIEEGRISNGIEILQSYLKLEPLDSEIEEYVMRLKQE